jgi:hypothetical protein
VHTFSEKTAFSAQKRSFNRFHRNLQKSVPLSADFYRNLRATRALFRFLKAEKSDRCADGCASCDLNLSKTFNIVLQ